MQLGVWDLRLRQKVRLFREHVNDYRRCSLLLDSFQSTLIAGDGDGGGRGWVGEKDVCNNIRALFHCPLSWL